MAMFLFEFKNHMGAHKSCNIILIISVRAFPRRGGLLVVPVGLLAPVGPLMVPVGLLMAPVGLLMVPVGLLMVPVG